ncbi:MAG: PE family protein [Mycobacterium sp.]
MSFVSVVPEAVSSAAGNLESIGSTLNVANNAAAAPTAGLVPVAADQVSAAVTAAFAQHAQDYQFIGAQVAAFHSQFVNTLNTGLGQYVDTEAANAQQAAASAVNGPVQALLGHPLASPGGAGTPDAPADPSITVLNSPFGPVSPAATSTNPDGSLTSRSARPAVPAPSASPTGYAGAPYNAAVAHGNGLAAAAQTGNALLAAGAWFGAPFNVLNAVLYGHQTLTSSPASAAPRAGRAAVSTISAPRNGFLGPLEPVTLTLAGSGSPTILRLDQGALFGGAVSELKELGAR